jgi:hypothetical protein
MSKAYNFYQLVLIIWAICFLLCSHSNDNSPPVDFSPIYKDAIKAVDPLEYFRDDLGAKDFAGY